MAKIQDWIAGASRRPVAQIIAKTIVALGLCAVTAASAVVVKEFRAGVHPLAAVDVVSIDTTPSNPTTISSPSDPAPADAPAPVAGTVLASNEAPAAEADQAAQTEPGDTAQDRADEAAQLGIDASILRYAADPSVRWFNGRPIRPARKMWMTVTAYSPDEKSCGPTADGHTATLHSVSTNNMKLVAADTSVLPFGSVVSIPGYNDGKIVPVLDRGGAIKGRHLDVLFPTDAQARNWGKKKLQVTVWEYADGKPADNPRKLR